MRLVEESGKPLMQVARELGIRPDLLYSWTGAVKWIESTEVVCAMTGPSVASAALSARNRVTWDFAHILSRSHTDRSRSTVRMPADDIVVRYASLSDLAFVSQDGYVRTSVVERKIRERDVVLAFQNTLAVGYLRLEWLWSKLPYIELIRVMEPHRRSGVGRALLSFVVAEAITQGHPVLYSSAQADEPEPQAWHRRMGFEECGILNGVNEGGVGEVFFRYHLLDGPNRFIAADV